MRTENQKKASQLLYSIPYLSPCATNRWVRLFRVNNVLYISAGSITPNYGALERIKKYARQHNWQPLDLFPVRMIDNDKHYYALGFILRLDLFRDKELQTLLVRDIEWAKGRMDDTLRLIESAEITNDYSFTISNKEALDSINAQNERRRLIAAPNTPDIDTCISVLKQAGYKILKPITDYQEI